MDKWFAKVVLNNFLQNSGSTDLKLLVNKYIFRCLRICILRNDFFYLNGSNKLLKSGFIMEKLTNVALAVLMSTAMYYNSLLY